MDFSKWKMAKMFLPLFCIGVFSANIWQWVQCVANSPSWASLPIVYLCTYSGRPNILSTGASRNQVFGIPVLLLIERRNNKNYCLIYHINDNMDNQSKLDNRIRFNVSSLLKCPNYNFLIPPLLNGKPPPSSPLMLPTYKSFRISNLNCSFHIYSNRKIRIKRNTKTLSVITGKMITVRCSATSGFEMKDTKWEKDSLRLPVNHRQRILQDGNLVIDNVQREDEGSYKCTTTDSKGREHVQIIAIRVIAAPTISLSDFQPDIQIGMKMKVLCSVLQGDSPFRFTWIKDGEPVSTDLGLSIQYYGDWSMLSSDNVQLNHAGNYTCVVSNEAATAKQSSVLRVNAPPIWVLEPNDSEVVHGKSVRIDCSTTGSPVPSISWKRASGSEPGDFTPVYNSHKYTLYANGSLLIQNADKSEEGYYLCQSNNGFGAGLSKLLFIKVHEPPRFEIKFKALASKKGDTANLFCQALGDFPIKIKWWRNNKQLENDTRIRIESIEDESQKTVDTTLTIIKTQSDDSGVYICRAVNSYGEDETSVKLLVQEPPGSPPNLGVVNVTGRSITVSWNEPYRGNSAITRYLIQYKKADVSSFEQNITVPSSQTMASIINLKPSTTYKIRLMAENSVGRGHFTSWLNATTDEEAPGGPAENVTARATGPNSIKVSWKSPKKEMWHGGISGYYVGYKETFSSDSFQYKTVKTAYADRLHEVHLTNLKRSTTYVVIVQAYNTKGTGPSTEEVTVKTLDDVPPSAPSLKLLSATKSSITLGWSQKTTFGNPVREYLLYHKKDLEPWIQIPISTDTPVYIVKNLTCGTSYQFYITAHNSVGKSEPSEILTARTEAPLSPHKDDFISSTMNEATLNILSWKNGGCDILYFTIKIRQKFRRTWSTLTNELLYTHNHYIVPNLLPSTWYELHVTAHSTAGATEAQYEFKTWNVTEELTIRATPELPRPKTSPLVTDLEILIPIVVSSLVVFVVIIVGCILCSKETHCNTRNNAAVLRHSSSKYTREAVAMKELTSPPDCMSSEDGTQRSSSQSTSHYPPGQPLYCPRPAFERAAL
uniref:Dscam16 n=1 Tax=Olivierus martensii TaxID=34649 RepID=A0A510ACJ7_OLIMR|nr:Dscam16 [Mesobuthus martensii]